MLVKIGKALKTCAEAIRTAIERYNEAATQLNPPCKKLTWANVVMGESRLGWDRYPKCPAGLLQPVCHAPHYQDELRVPSSESDGVHSHHPALYVPHGHLKAHSI